MELELTEDDVSTLDSASSGEFSTSFDPSGLTQAQIAALKAIAAWIKSHPG